MPGFDEMYFSALDALDGGDDDYSALDALADDTKPKKPKAVKPTSSVAPKQALTQSELEEVLRQAGWDEKHIPKMSAIGMAEAAHTPDGRAKVDSYNPGIGHGGKPTKERSYGLWQINMIDPERQRKYDKNRLASDPVYNAQVAGLVRTIMVKCASPLFECRCGHPKCFLIG